MDNQVKPPSAWDLWVATPLWRKLPVILMLVIGIWLYPLSIFIDIAIFTYFYTRRNK